MLRACRADLLAVRHLPEWPGATLLLRRMALALNTAKGLQVRAPRFPPFPCRDPAHTSRWPSHRSPSTPSRSQHPVLNRVLRVLCVGACCAQHPDNNVRLVCIELLGAVVASIVADKKQVRRAPGPPRRTRAARVTPRTTSLRRLLRLHGARCLDSRLAVRVP